MSSAVRTGYSLMEVILATAILLGSAVVLGELASIGRKHVNSAEKLATAQLLCETKLNEILAGLSPLESVAESPLLPTDHLPSGEFANETPGSSQIMASEALDDESQWLYFVDVQPLEFLGLVALKVTVTEDIEIRRPVRFSIVRWVRDPAYQQDVSISGNSVPQRFGVGSQP